jgi:hypothetical protein
MKQILVHAGRQLTSACFTIAVTLCLALFAAGAHSQNQPLDSTPCAQASEAQTYQTFYLTYATQQQSLNDIQTDLRNLLPKAKIYGVASQTAISVRGSVEDIELAKRVLADLDRPSKTYRLTYTFRETDAGKPVESRQVALMATVSGSRTEFKQGTKVPIVTGTADSSNTKQETEMQYVDVGLNIEASLDLSGPDLKLWTKVAQSSVAEEKSSLSAQDPVIHQAVIQEQARMIEGKPLVLGALDIPGSTRREQVEVVAELVP